MTAKSGLITVVGSIVLENGCSIDIESIVRFCCKEVGFDHIEKGLDHKLVNIIIEVDISETS